MTPGITSTLPRSLNTTSPSFSRFDPRRRARISRHPKQRSLYRRGRGGKFIAQHRTGTAAVRAAATPFASKWKRIVRPDFGELLLAFFDLRETDLYKLNGPLSMTHLLPLVTNDAFAKLKDRPFQPATRSGSAAACQHFRSHAKTGHFAPPSVRKLRSHRPVYRDAPRRSAGPGDQDHALSHER